MKEHKRKSDRPPPSLFECDCGHVNSLHAGYIGTCAGFVGDRISCGCKKFQVTARKQYEERNAKS